MMSKILPFGLLLMLLCPSVTIAAAPNQPTIRLPTDLVTMNAVYGTTSYFDLTLSDVPVGFDITNATYPGWCVQKNMDMTQHVNHAVLLFSSTSQDLPLEYHTIHWEYINYLLNHKQGNRTSIQHAIWYFTNDLDCVSDPDAYAMVIDAELRGECFIPSAGQLIAIPIIGVPSIQLTFLETLIPQPQAIEGLVWDDLNRNGIQDNGEPGKNAIHVYLSQQNNMLINTTMTGTTGTYQFTNITTGSYYLTIVLPKGYHFSPQDIGTNDMIDSDVDANGRTPVFMITLNHTTQEWDAGMYTPTSRPAPPQNHQPTADGTAGEPYQGFISQIITFNGSRSYDRDGSIISWLWSYGDGTTQNGAITTHAYKKPGDYPVSLIVTDNDYASDTYTTIAHITQGNNPPSIPTIIGPTSGHANILYDYILVATDADNDNIRYIITWDDNHTDTSIFVASGQPISLTHQWITRGFYTIHAYTQDHNNATSPITQIILAIDVHYVGAYGYLIDTNSDGIYEMFYSNSTHQENRVKHLENGDYLIDIDNDGTWDIVYNPNNNQYISYTESPLLQYLLIVLLIIAILLMFFILRIKKQTRKLTSDRKNKQ